MESKNDHSSDWQQNSLGVRICVNLIWALLNLLIIIFLLVTKLIILLLSPFVILSLLLENMNLKVRKFILEQNVKTFPEDDIDETESELPCDK